MPEEKSVLTTETMKLVLDIKYRIAISNIKALKHGSANCFCVSDEKKSYFLKEFQSHFSEDDLRRETDLVNYLQQNGYPTAKIIPTANGKLYFKYNDRLILLQEWIEGKTHTDNNLPRYLLMEAAELLGKLHNILHDYTLPRDMDTEWLNAFSPDKAAEQYGELLDALETQKSDALYKHIKSDLIYKKELVYLIAKKVFCWHNLLRHTWRLHLLSVYM